MIGKQAIDVQADSVKKGKIEFPVWDSTNWQSV
jgi:hypothetical protein